MQCTQFSAIESWGALGIIIASTLQGTNHSFFLPEVYVQMYVHTHTRAHTWLHTYAHVPGFLLQSCLLKHCLGGEMAH